MKNKSRSKTSMQDSAYDLLGKMMLEQEAKEITLEIEAERGTEAEKEMDAFFAQHENEHLRLIQQCVRRNNRVKTFSKNMFLRALHSAAAAIACLFVIGSVALASSSYVRIQVMRLLSNVTPEYTELSLSVAREMNIPGEWKGTYYPGVIPESTEVSYMESDESYSCVFFAGNRNNDQWKLSFTEYADAIDVRVDTEGASKVESIINGHEVTIMEKDGLITIYWSDDLRLLVLQTQFCSLSETITYASNIMMIR